MSGKLGNVLVTALALIAGTSIPAFAAPSVPVVPEPGTLVFLGAGGVVALLLIARRRK